MTAFFHWQWIQYENHTSSLWLISSVMSFWTDCHLIEDEHSHNVKIISKQTRKASVCENEVLACLIRYTCAQPNYNASHYTCLNDVTYTIFLTFDWKILYTTILLGSCVHYFRSWMLTRTASSSSSYEICFWILLN